jgi:hypothetical protein
MEMYQKCRCGKWAKINIVSDTETIFMCGECGRWAQGKDVTHVLTKLNPEGEIK